MSTRNYTKLKINESADQDRNTSNYIEDNRSGSNTKSSNNQNGNIMNGYISGDRTGSSSAHQFHRSDPDGKIK